MTNGFNLQATIQQSANWVQQKYTVEEIAKQAMAQREMEKAKAAVESQEGFLGLTIQNKLKQMMVPEVVMEELQNVAVQTLMGTVEPFMKWLEENEIAYSENMFQDAIQRDAKTMFYTRYALEKQAAGDGKEGMNFYASF